LEILDFFFYDALSVEKAYGNEMGQRQMLCSCVECFSGQESIELFITLEGRMKHAVRRLQNNVYFMLKIKTDLYLHLRFLKFKCGYLISKEKNSL